NWAGGRAGSVAGAGGCTMAAGGGAVWGAGTGAVAGAGAAKAGPPRLAKSSGSETEGPPPIKGKGSRLEPDDAGAGAAGAGAAGAAGALPVVPQLSKSPSRAAPEDFGLITVRDSCAPVSHDITAEPSPGGAAGGRPTAGAGEAA